MEKLEVKVDVRRKTLDINGKVLELGDYFEGATILDYPDKGFTLRLLYPNRLSEGIEQYIQTEEEKLSLFLLESGWVGSDKQFKTIGRTTIPPSSTEKSYIQLVSEHMRVKVEGYD